MKKKASNKSVSYAYVGRWLDGSLGWNVPTHIHRSETRKRPRSVKLSDTEGHGIGEWAELCKITIEPVKNEKGKPVRRRFVK